MNSLTLFMTMMALYRGTVNVGYRATWWFDSNNSSGLTQYLGDNNTTVMQSGVVGTIQG